MSNSAGSAAEMGGVDDPGGGPFAVVPRMAVASPAVFPKLGAESPGLRAFRAGSSRSRWRSAAADREWHSGKEKSKWRRTRNWRHGWRLDGGHRRRRNRQFDGRFVVREQYGRIGGFHRFGRRLGFGDWCDGRERQAIAATSARHVRAIAQNCFARRNQHRVLGPENVVSDPVRNIERLRLLQPLDPRVCHHKIRIVRPHGRIALDRIAQLT